MQNYHNNKDSHHVARKPFWKRYTRKQLLKRAGRIFLWGLGILLLMFIWFSKDLPTPNRIEKRLNIGSTQILDRNGELLYAVSQNKKRLVIPFSEMPDNVKKATIAIEDQNFYHHFGIDIKGVIRSVFVDIIHRGAKQGGSTITQQFVKNALLDPRKTLTRKFKELILSVELEAIYPKDKILELYLNEIPYGSTAYGIDAASRTYFGKPAKDLSLAESATLAALPQAPTYFSPYGENKDALLKRKDTVLTKMEKLGMITSKGEQDAKAETITFQPRKDSIQAPHFVFYIQQLIADKYGEEALQSGGLKITTSLELKTQKEAQAAIDEGSKKLDRYGANNAALVAVDPRTGQVLAMVGSRDYFNQDIQGQVNVTTSNRQPGSSFKPIVYATAFKDKYNPAYPLFDLTTNFGNYTPTNYDGNTHGAVSMRAALANSLNIPAVKTLALVGLKNALSTASDLGITTLTEPDRYGLALVLGGGEVKPIEMAGAFSVFANQGKLNPINPILKVEDKKGRILEEFKDPENKQVLDPQVAYLISDVLSDNEARKMVFGFTNNLTIGGRRVAVKTGTTSEYHDAWTVGYTPQISTAVWAGNTNNDAMGKGADGSVVAAPIWNAFMRNYLSDKNNEDFTRPEGIQETTVDFLSNKLVSDQSPSSDNRKDIFASWQIPKNKDDIHVLTKVNKVNGKLATDQTPTELVEERLYTNIHSEKPDNSNWESPVRSWAQAAGLINDPPKDKDDMYTLDRLPVVSISTPINNQKVGASIDVAADAAGYYGINKVVYKIDESEIGYITEPGYKGHFSTANFSPGTYTLTAVVYDSNGVSKVSPTVSIIIANDSSAPVIGVVYSSTTASSATLTWTTNEPATSKVEYGLTATLGSSSVESSQSGINHSVTINGLSSATTYYYRVVNKDQSGNATNSSVYSFTTK